MAESREWKAELCYRVRDSAKIHLSELHIYTEGSNSDFIFISKNNGVGFPNDSYSN